MEGQLVKESVRSETGNINSIQLDTRLRFNGKTLSGIGSEYFSVPDYSEESLHVISRLEKVFRRINTRMKNDGYCIKNGILTKVI